MIDLNSLSFYQLECWKNNEVIIVGDFNVHTDIDNDSLGSVFISLLDSVDFSQCVHKLSHFFNHTLDPWIEIEKVFVHNHFLSAHYLKNNNLITWIHGTWVHASRQIFLHYMFIRLDCN